ncbi:acyltransferase family protein [Methylobacterium mesophilicum]
MSRQLIGLEQVDIERSDRKAWIDVARGVSIFLVVIYHINLWFDDLGFGMPILLLLDKAFRSIRMPLFFFVSGYLLAINKNSDWTAHIHRRLRLIVYLYGLWGLIDWIVAYEFNLITTRMKFGSSFSQLLSMWYRPETGLWFIWALAIYLLLANLFTQIKPVFVLFATSVLSVLAMSKYFPMLNFAQNSSLYYAPFFFLGVTCGGGIEKIILRYIMPSFAILFSAYAIVCAVLMDMDFSGLAFGIVRFADCIIGALLGCCFAVLISKYKVCRWLFGNLGRKTLQIYLPHETIVALLTIQAVQYIDYFNIKSLILVPVVLFSAILGSLVLAELAMIGRFNFLYRIPDTFELILKRRQALDRSKS